MVYSTIFTLIYIVPEGKDNCSSHAWANKPQKVKETFPEVICSSTIQGITSPTSANLGLEPNWLQCQFCIPVSSVNFLPLEYCGLRNCDQSKMSHISSSHAPVQMQCQFFTVFFFVNRITHEWYSRRWSRLSQGDTIICVWKIPSWPLHWKASCSKTPEKLFFACPRPNFLKISLWPIVEVLWWVIGLTLLLFRVRVPDFLFNVLSSEEPAFYYKQRELCYNK